MLTDTPQLLRLVKQRTDVRGRLDALRNVCDGRTAYIVSCGPSMRAHEPAVLRERLRGELVIAIKQAYNVLDRQVDFHLTNHTNCQRYRYGAKRPIRMWTELDGEIIAGPKPDLPLQFAHRERDLNWRIANAVARTNAWDRFRFSETPDRPIGPGILYEQAFYLALHLGVVRVVTLGWDITNPARHFYGATGDDDQDGGVGDGSLDSSRVAVEARTAGQPARRPPEHPSAAYRAARRMLGEWYMLRLATTYDHYRGVVYNARSAYEGEVELIVKASGDVHRWLARSGVALEVITDSDAIDAAVPRTTLEGSRHAVGT